MTQTESLIHNGVKGMKWGYDHGTPNGKRKAETREEFLERFEKEKVERTLTAEPVIHAEQKKDALGVWHTTYYVGFTSQVNGQTETTYMYQLSGNNMRARELADKVEKQLAKAQRATKSGMLKKKLADLGNNAISIGSSFVSDIASFFTSAIKTK